MANTYGSPWVIDTAGYISPNDPSRGTREYKRIYFRGIIMDGYSGGTSDAAIITAGSGGPEVLRLLGTADNAPVSYLRVNSQPFVDPYISQLPTGAKLIVDIA